ncbi:hypothetical protein [Roseomonas xinghualingensis]|uniref:hypothetical protein n=1 Tax=Roseomonas xinghualingensis TaxID=2986475 RepID=UPI0021F1980E|nr:hypothetical protein [Roseomonas sp. SXEYE001]MCV4206254.1 hypothetical protein [Roseomonas sp. SXEYE001]
MSMLISAEPPGGAQSAVLGLTLFEVAQARNWATSLAQHTGELYRAEAVTSQDGAVMVGITTPSSKEDALIRPGDFNWHVLRTPSGIHLAHPVNGGLIASFSDIDSALVEIAFIEEGMSLMRSPDLGEPEAAREVA